MINITSIINITLLPILSAVPVGYADCTFAEGLDPTKWVSCVRH